MNGVINGSPSDRSDETSRDDVEDNPGAVHSPRGGSETGVGKKPVCDESR